MRKALVLLVVLLLLPCFAIWAEGQKDKTAAANVTLNVWLGSTFVSTADQKLPQNEWYVTGLLEQFEKSHPGVQTEFTLLSNVGTAHQSFKAAAMAGNAPDVCNLWTGEFVFALKDILYNISKKIPAADRSQILNWEVCAPGYNTANGIYGYPTSGSVVAGFIYNKKLVSAAGVDLEKNPPKNPAEFISALEKIKATGVLPIVSNEDGFNRVFTFTFATWWAGMVGNKGVYSDSLGKKKFADDRYFIESFKKVSEIYTKGLLNTDYASCQDADTTFSNGKAAMLSQSSSRLPVMIKNLGQDNIGFFISPDFKDGAANPNATIGGAGHSLCIPKDVKNIDLAIELCSFINSRENHLALLKRYPRLPIRQDITLKDLGWEGIPVFEKAFGMGKNVILFPDNNMSPDVANEFYKLGVLVVVGKMTPEEMAKRLDTMVQDAK
jgi:raffinose/stachyose/melibiose transport system substrate-binding protein